VAGARYRVLARHALVPWLQIDGPQGLGWVYLDLVTVTGNLALVPVVSEFGADATATLPPATPTRAPDGAPSAPGSARSPTPTITGPVATTLGEANVRFGPDIEYPVIVKVEAGKSFRVLERHTLLPWIKIALDGSPTGAGWIFSDIVEVTGNLNAVSGTDALQFAYPTLTPTPETLLIPGAPSHNAPLPTGDLANTLGREMNAYLLEQGFAPFSERIASVFVLDLNTNDAFTINDGIAYSGMSLTKIPILAAYFRRLRGPLSYDQAFLVADTMMCSENITTNQMLEQIGDGDPLAGAQRVTGFMQSLGLRGTFIMRQYVIREDEAPVGAGTISTGADQIAAQPDLYNQIVPQDLGWLLAGIYQCAQNETGLLVERFPSDFDAQKCRQMLYAMDGNVINVFLEAGVPPTATVIHKHGWIADTHGDAGIVIGPDGAYVLVAALHARDWLEFEITSPVMAELSRLTWNALNPSTPQANVNIGFVPDTCDPRSSPVIDALMSSNLPALSSPNP
jgi:beta-lactamase class A/uncharacterized protein YraI